MEDAVTFAGAGSNQVCQSDLAGLVDEKHVQRLFGGRVGEQPGRSRHQLRAGGPDVAVQVQDDDAPKSPATSLNLP